jgi:lipopolysaccharide/colanic/teichoic acid biosynthesis glycosyltransferase
MTRFLDIVLALVGGIFAVPVVAVIAIMIRMTSPGPAIFAQRRVGRREKVFTCYKLRTMRIDTPQAASHLVGVSALTSIGSFLRSTKLDELPQLWNVLWGEMSLVGPRPCLPSQTELIACRRELGIYDFRPGITGIAQVNDIDMSDPRRLAEMDRTYQPTVGNYFRILLLTVAGNGQGDRVHK